jgi:predicted metal-dependent HD superfamily phosphohydrolase
MLEKKFKTLSQNYTNDTKLITQLWEEISHEHSKVGRHYHSLKHLEQIYQVLKNLEVTPLLAFATFYHDIVYEAFKTDNEEQSALLAQKRLRELNVPKALTQKVFQLIIETKTHHASSEEHKLFLDADLTILGSNEKTYTHYTQQVRKEYAIYDDATYFSGRKKVLKMFLEKEKIYKTQYFHDKYEKQARVNMLIEYNSLT